MARQIINVGSSANDGTGDSIRAGMVKVNTNFEKLFAANPDAILDLGNASGSLTLDTDVSTQRVNVTGNLSLSGISNGSPNKTIELWLYASGSNWTFDPSSVAVTPSLSGVVWPKTMMANNWYVFKAKFVTQWNITAFEGGYPG